MIKSPFIPNQVYKRKLIHDEYGGNRQSGISPSATNPFIFIFSGKSGAQYGFRDLWVSASLKNTLRFHRKKEYLYLNQDQTLLKEKSTLVCRHTITLKIDFILIESVKISLLTTHMCNHNHLYNQKWV
jgi:hypothetical protein